MPPEKLKISFSRLRICWKKSRAVLPHLGSTIQVKKSKAHPWGHSWQFSGPVAGSASLLLLLLYFCYTASFYFCYTAYVDFYFCIPPATFLLPPHCLPPTSNNALLILRSLLRVVLSVTDQCYITPWVWCNLGYPMGKAKVYGKSQLHGKSQSVWDLSLDGLCQCTLAKPREVTKSNVHGFCHGMTFAIQQT